MLRSANAKQFSLVAGLAVVSSAASVGQGLVHRLDPELGARYQGTMTMDTRTRGQIQGMDIDVSTTLRMEQDVVFEAGSDDTVVGRYTVTSMAVPGGVPGMDQAPFDPNDLYRGMLGRTFTLVMTRGGEIVELNGFDAMIDAMLGRPQASAELRAVMSEVLEGNFGEAQLKRMAGRSGLSMPDHPVAVGDVWTDSADALGIETETTYTLTGRSDGLATVEATATLSGAEDAGFEFPGLQSVPGMALRFEHLAGSFRGVYELDEATGLTSAYSMKMAMETEVVMGTPQVEGQPAGPSMSMSMSMETTTEGTLRQVE